MRPWLLRPPVLFRPRTSDFFGLFFVDVSFFLYGTTVMPRRPGDVGLSFFIIDFYFDKRGAEQATSSFCPGVVKAKRQLYFAGTYVPIPVTMRVRYCLPA